MALLGAFLRMRPRCDQKQRVRVRSQIAPKQLPGIRGDPMQPFKTRLLHPCRSPGISASYEVETAPTSDEPARLNAMPIFYAELLFTRFAESDPHNVRARSIDLLANCSLFCGGEVTVCASSDLQRRI